MKIKETIRTTRFDDRGRLVVTDRTIYYDHDVNHNYDYATMCNAGRTPGVHQSSFGRIYESYNDYRESERWD